jgi:serine protease Do
MNVLNQINSALDDLLEQVGPVLVVVGDKRGGAGGGVLVGDGLVLTNHHVARHSRALQVMLDSNETFPARVVASDPDVDLSLLEIQSNGRQASNGHRVTFSTREPRPGELVFAFGHPWGERNVLTGGVLSAVTSVRTRKSEIPILRADVQLAPGNSGGPLINSAGEVIGLNAMIFGGDQSVAIPASVIRQFLDKARQHLPAGRVPEGVL